MAPPVDLPSLLVGDEIQDEFLVCNLDHRGGDLPYTILTLGNRSGRLPTAPFWSSEQNRLAGIDRGDVVEVKGEVTSYRDRRQLRVMSLQTVPRAREVWRRLMPRVPEVTPYWDTLDRWRGEIRSPQLAGTLALWFDDPAFRERYAECPGSLSGHHAILGGLLQHTAEVATIAKSVAAVSGADQELVLAGALLHDIGKLEAYRWDGCLDLTEAGALVGHVVLGSLMLAGRIQRLDHPPCTRRETLLLQHLILSHHGKLEFGAAVPPMTLEAEALHYADDASAKTASMCEALSDPDQFRAGALLSARAVWQLDRRRVFRGRSDWGRESDP